MWRSCCPATLRVAAAGCAPLTRLCYRKTGGNPFFLNQFLHAIHDAGHLRYRAAQDCWDWDLAAIEQADYTDNVVDLLLEKIRRLPAATQQLLQLAASIGNRFTLDTLAVVIERARLARAARPVAGAGRRPDPAARRALQILDADAGDSGVSYRFLHDRVQQAAYLIADAGCARGQPPAHRPPAAGARRRAAPGSQLFEIVEQLNAGRALIDDAGERVSWRS